MNKIWLYVAGTAGLVMDGMGIMYAIEHSTHILWIISIIGILTHLACIEKWRMRVIERGYCRGLEAMKRGLA